MVTLIIWALLLAQAIMRPSVLKLGVSTMIVSVRWLHWLKDQLRLFENRLSHKPSLMQRRSITAPSRCENQHLSAAKGSCKCFLIFLRNFLPIREVCSGYCSGIVAWEGGFREKSPRKRPGELLKRVSDDLPTVGGVLT